MVPLLCLFADMRCVFIRLAPYRTAKRREALCMIFYDYPLIYRVTRRGFVLSRSKTALDEPEIACF